MKLLTYTALKILETQMSVYATFDKPPDKKEVVTDCVNWAEVLLRQCAENPDDQIKLEIRNRYPT